MREMNLVILSRLTGKSDRGGVPLFQHNEGEYIQALADRLGGLTLVAPVVTKDDVAFYTLPEYTFRFRDNVKLVRLPTPRSYTLYDKLRTGLQNVATVLARDLGEVFFYVFLPHPWWVLLASVTRRPFAAYVGSDWPAVLRSQRKPAVLSFLAETAVGNVVRRSRFTLVTGTELQQRYARYGRTFLAAPISSIQRLPPHSGPRARHRLQPLRILTVSALIARKRVDIVIQAFAEILSSGFSAELLIVGDGPQKETLRQMASRLGVGDRVQWLGYVTDPDRLREIYEGCDVFVLATAAEGFPRVIWEATMRGVPVVVSRLPSICSTVVDGQHALLVDGDDPLAFAGAISRIARDPTFAANLVANARRRWSELFPQPDPVEQFISLARVYAPRLFEGRTPARG